MLGGLSVILANPINQILLSVPLSVVGNFSSDAVKALATSFNRKEGFKDLEDTLFAAFLKAIEMHQGRYDVIAKKESARLKNIARRKKSEFLLALKSYDSQDEHHIPNKIDDVNARKLLAQKITEVFKKEIPEERLELVEAITRDTLSFYKEAFFKEITQDTQLWIVFRESLKITSISEVLKEIQANLPTREDFEIVRSYIVKNEPNPEVISGLKSQYFDYLTRKFSSIELTGISPRVHGQDISFNMKEIFIPFNIESSEIGKNNSRRTLPTSRSDYWSSLFPENETLIDDKIKLLKNLAQFSQIVLLGDPGCGKTTLLKFITYQIADFQKQDEFLPFYVPIFLRISEYAQILKGNPSKHLLDFLINDYDKQFSSLFSWAFENCQVLLLLDGLDEVLDVSQRIKVVEEVQDIVARMPENRYVLTSRIIGYDRAQLGREFNHFTIKKFNRNQIRAFCRSWYKSVSRTSLQGTTSSQLGADKLYNAIISRKAIEDLACNPLMITLIANMHFKGQSIPHNRVQLYDIATETLLEYWVQRRVTDETKLKDKDDIVEILSPVSFYIHENNPHGLIAEDEFYTQCSSIFERDEYDLNFKDVRREVKDLIRFLREQSGFFHEKGVDELTGKSFFGFLHQTFQEYFTGIEIVNQWKEGTVDFYELLQNSRWTESLRLAAGILNTEKGRSRKRSASQFVESILHVDALGEEVYIRAILLVTLILIDEIDLNSKVQESCFNVLFDTWNSKLSKDLNDELEKNLALLLNSKHRANIWEKIKLVLEDTKFSQVKSKIPQFIVQNCLPLKEAKEVFHNCLLSDSHQISLSAWAALKKYISDLDASAYYGVQEQYQYYGTFHYPDYWPSTGEILGYSEFFEKLNLLSNDVFLSIMDNLTAILNSYLYLYYPDQDYWGYSSKDLFSEMMKKDSEKARVLFLNLILKRSDLLSFEEEIQNILGKSHFESRLISEVRNKIIQKLSQFKSAAT